MGIFLLMLVLGGYIVYNTLYNICLIIDEHSNVMDKIVKQFPEFKVIDKFNDMTSEDNINFVNFFHCKMFKSVEDIEKKIESFKNLYDIKNTNLTVNGKEYTEKEEILTIIDKEYEQNTNPADKIKATDIYNTINNCILNNKHYGNELAFRKRVSGYLIDLGLTRKRFGDGIYYYGLVKKDSTSLSIDDVMKRRETEYIADMPKCSTIAKLDARKKVQTEFYRYYQN